MMSKFLKFFVFSVPVFFGFACSNDDENGDDSVGSWPPVIWEYDGTDYKSAITIQVPNSGGEYKLKCKNYNPWITSFNICTDTTTGVVSYKKYGKSTDGREYEIVKTNAKSDTLCPANSKDDVCDWFWIVLQNGGKEYSVIVKENNGSARSAEIAFSVGDVGGRVNFVQEGQ